MLVVVLILVDEKTYARSEEEVLVSCGTEFSGWKIPMPAVKRKKY
jgi:hypothetical protein